MSIPMMGVSAPRNKTAVIYALIDPRDRTAFYVGVTTRKLAARLSSHLNDGVILGIQNDRCSKIRDVHEAGSRIEIMELEVVPIASWAEAEKFWIEYLRSLGARLTNIGTGGPGASGAKQSAATKARRKAAAVGRKISHCHSGEIRKRAADATRHVIEVDGVRYLGIAAAARELGIGSSTLHYRLDVGLATRITPRKNDNVRTRKGGRKRAEEHHHSRPVVYLGVWYWGLTEVSMVFGVKVGTVYTWLRQGRVRYASDCA